jgi:hypothetical protein
VQEFGCVITEVTESDSSPINLWGAWARGLGLS